MTNRDFWFRVLQIRLKCLASPSNGDIQGKLRHLPILVTILCLRKQLLKLRNRNHKLIKIKEFVLVKNSIFFNKCVAIDIHHFLKDVGMWDIFYTLNVVSLISMNVSKYKSKNKNSLTLTYIYIFIYIWTDR